MYLRDTDPMHSPYLIVPLFPVWDIKRKRITHLGDIVTSREIILCWLQEVSRMMAVTRWSHLCPQDEYRVLWSWKATGELMLCKHNSLLLQIWPAQVETMHFTILQTWTGRFKTGKKGVLKDSGLAICCESQYTALHDRSANLLWREQGGKTLTSGRAGLWTLTSDLTASDPAYSSGPPFLWQGGVMMGAWVGHAARERANFSPSALQHKTRMFTEERRQIRKVLEVWSNQHECQTVTLPSWK